VQWFMPPHSALPPSRDEETRAWPRASTRSSTRRHQRGILGEGCHRGYCPGGRGHGATFALSKWGKLDLQIEDGQVKIYRAKVKVSFESRNRP